MLGADNAAIIEAARKAEEEFKSGFILSDSPMNWSDAKAFCLQKGGRLPRINNSDSWDGKGEFTIDGFGTIGTPWPSDLPDAHYWTSTEYTANPGLSWVLGGGSIHVNLSLQSHDYRVICVP